MKKYLVFATLALLAFACSKSDSGEKKPAVAAADGSKVFNLYCVACHGADGTAQMSGAKDLQLSTLTLDERIEVITNGRNLMAPWKEILSPEKIKAAAEYTMTRNK